METKRIALGPNSVRVCLRECRDRYFESREAISTIHSTLADGIKRRKSSACLKPSRPFTLHKNVRKSTFAPEAVHAERARRRQGCNEGSPGEQRCSQRSRRRSDRQRVLEELEAMDTTVCENRRCKDVMEQWGRGAIYVPPRTL